MTIAEDTTSILDDWNDDPLTIVRSTGSTTYSDTGEPTKTYATVGAANLRADVQPVSGDTIREEVGNKVKTTHEIFFDDGTDVKGDDRIRRTGFSAGDNEFIVLGTVADNPSHVIARCILVRGHAP